VPKTLAMLHGEAETETVVETTAVSVRSDKSALQTEALSWGERARGLSIVDAQSCINASQLLKSVKGLELEIDHWFEPHIEAAMETKRTAEAARKALVDEHDRMKAPLVEAEGLIKRALLRWEDVQEHARQTEERRLQEAARQEAERVTLDAAAAMESEAIATGDDGLLQEAKDILDQPIEAPVVTVTSFMPAVRGVSYRDHWKAKAHIDLKALAAAVTSGQAPVTFLLPNTTAINAFARATQGTQTVAGVEFYNDRQIITRQDR